MTATDILRNEHDAILKMLELTSEIGEQIEAGEHIEAQVLRDLLEFFQVFADRCHHGKEEDVLFPLLEKRGLPRAGGPIGVMLSEHVQGRELIHEMSESAMAYARNEPRAGARWAAVARAYSILLRNHIDKENHILFHIADQILNVADQRTVLEAFENLEVEKIGAGTHERLHASMERLLRDQRLKATA